MKYIILLFCLIANLGISQVLTYQDPAIYISQNVITVNTNLYTDLIPLLTNNTAEIGTAYGSSINGVLPTPPYYAFDRNTSTYWWCIFGQISGQYAGFHFNTPQIATAFNFSGNFGSGFNYVLEASNDDSNYTQLNSGFITSNSSIGFTVLNNTTAYTYYRIRCTTSGSGVIQIFEINLYH